MAHTWWLPLRRDTVPESHDTKLCNYVQNGLATMSIFALQLWVLLFYNKHLCRAKTNKKASSEYENPYGNYITIYINNSTNITKEINVLSLTV